MTTLLLGGKTFPIIEAFFFGFEFRPHSIIPVTWNQYIIYSHTSSTYRSVEGHRWIINWVTKTQPPSSPVENCHPFVACGETNVCNLHLTPDTPRQLSASSKVKYQSLTSFTRILSRLHLLRRLSHLLNNALHCTKIYFRPVLQWHNNDDAVRHSILLYSLSQNGWDTLGSPCPPNVGVQHLVTEPPWTTLRGTRGAREGKKQRLVKVSQLFLSETVSRRNLKTCWEIRRLICRSVTSDGLLVF